MTKAEQAKAMLRLIVFAFLSGTAFAQTRVPPCESAAGRSTEQVNGEVARGKT